MPRGASPKREHEFEKLKHQFQHDRRYPGREEEVAARIVNKQRSEAGETKSASSSSTRRAKAGIRSSASKKSSSAGKASHASASPSVKTHSGSPRLSIKEYAGLTIPEVTSRLGSLTLSQIRRLRDYELAHKHRKGMLDKLNRKLVH